MTDMKYRDSILVPIKRCKGYTMYWDTENNEVLMERDGVTYLIAKKNEVFSVKRGLESGVQRFYRRKIRK